MGTEATIYTENILQNIAHLVVRERRSGWGACELVIWGHSDSVTFQLLSRLTTVTLYLDPRK